MNSKPKVYIVNRSGHDFSAAEEFGETIFLSEGLIKRTEINTMYRAFAEKLKYSEADDYLVLTALTSMNTIAAAILGYMHGKLNILLFDDRSKKYTVRRISLGELLKEETKVAADTKDTDAEDVPWYDPEDCNDCDADASEMEWEGGCYTCSSCGAVQ